MIVTSHDLGPQMVASCKGHPLISGKSRLVNDPVWGPGKVVHFWADVVSFFDLGKGRRFWSVCGCGCGRVSHVPHTLSRWETLDDVFSGIQDLSFHNLPSILLVVASTSNPGHPPGILHAKLVQHPGSHGESRIAGRGVCSACDSGSLRADLWD